MLKRNVRRLLFACGAIAVLAVLLSIALWNTRLRSLVHPTTRVVVPLTGPFTIAAAGDTLIVHPIPTAEQDAAFRAAIEVVRSASLALTNLEVNLLGAEDARLAADRPLPRPLFGLAREAAELKSLGFDVAVQANNHAADYGADGMIETSRLLDDAGVLEAGAGFDLQQARAPVFAGARPRRIAIVALSSSAAPDAQATSTRGDIKGRPGVSPLRYVAEVTVDPQTYQTLKLAAPALRGTAPAGDDQLTFQGTTIRKGERTSVDLIVNERDVEAILAQVRAARANADVVIVSVHSHEPNNDSEEPADFFRTFARAAIDAGASMVFGHGPHRIRGIEVYKRGAILYSLGNFLFQSQDAQVMSLDPYDAGVDMYSLAAGVSDHPGARHPFGLDDNGWWEGAVAELTLTDDAHRTLRLYPIDLGVDLPPARRGIPRLASPPRAAEILGHLARLSERYGTRVTIANGVASIDLTRGNP